MPEPLQLSLLTAVQTLKASKALLQHLKTETERLRTASSKRNLLEEGANRSEDEDEDGGSTPIWLNLTTKQHIVDRNRLKPSRISIPHSLTTNPDLTICLITADPQRAVKNGIADSAFPRSLSTRINRVIGFTKLKARYKTFEMKRQLLSESDIFLADDRIINRLPDVLGKIFYKGTPKRPIPISIANVQRVDGKRVKATKTDKKNQTEDSDSVAAPTVVAQEIGRAINSASVSLKPGTSVAVRVGLSSFEPQDLMENVEAVTLKLVEKHIVKGWRNVKSIHIKSPTSMAIPIWNSDELWAGTDDVDQQKEPAERNTDQDLKRKRSSKTSRGPQIGQRKRVKVDVVQGESPDGLKDLEKSRKSKLASQKAQVFGSAAIAV